jgi:hypothetical protein
MNIIERIKRLFRPRVKPVFTRVPHLAGRRSRETIDVTNEFPFSQAFYILPPPDADSTWRSYNLDSKTLSRMAPADLMSLLVDISPEISRALFDFIRMMNPGYEVLALQPGTEEQDGPGQALVDDFLDRLKEIYGATEIQINRLILAGFLRGAFFAEVVLDEGGRLAVDLATPDPYSARFRKLSDPVRGIVYQLGQWQAGRWRDLTEPTVRYIPVDPVPGSPYGRSLVGPALFSAIFLIGMLHDLRRVVQQQGYPRLDLSIDLERLRLAMPADLESDPEAMKNWIDSIIDEVETVYNALEPDDAYIHTDVIGVNRPVGAVNADSLGAIDGLIRAIERMIIRALKTMPLLFGVNEATTETHANRQWELHAAGIKSLQHLLEQLLEHLLEQALRAGGIQAEVQFRFAELRASEMLRDAQTEAMLISNATAKYEAGWISQDEASLEVTGHEADQVGPRRQAGASIAPQIIQDGNQQAQPIGRQNGR